MRAGTASVGAGTGFVLASAAFGVLVAIAWLAGQAGARRLVWLAGGGVVGLVVVSGVVPSLLTFMPWGWVGAMWPTAHSLGAPVRGAGLVALVVVACSAVRPLLDSLTATRLSEDAEKWHATGLAAGSGDIAHAIGRLRARPTFGRTWRAVRGLRPPMRFLVADVIGGMRTPVRFAVGILALACAGLLIALAPASWVLAGAGAGLGYLALGVFSDGFRHAVDAAVAPALLGYPDAALFALHATLPAVVSAAAGGVGLVVAHASGVASSGPAVGLTLGLIVAVRAYDAAKGTLPAILLTPLAGPFGDLSSVSVSIWEVDALLISATAGAAIAALTHSGAVAASVAVTVALGSLVLVGLRRRVARL